jgi:hypothetical protein
MTLSAPTDRQLIHTRRVTCQGYRREDGLWDIEGRLLDTKSYDFANRDRGGAIRAGEAIHEMAVRVTLDDAFLIHKVEAVTEHAPFSICGDIAPAFAALVGLRLGTGFMRLVRERFGGVRGCTHLVELMGPIATTAFQTIGPMLWAEGGQNEPTRLIDSCHALAADGPVVAREWPDYSAQAKKR